MIKIGVKLLNLRDRTSVNPRVDSEVNTECRDFVLKLGFKLETNHQVKKQTAATRS